MPETSGYLISLKPFWRPSRIKSLSKSKESSLCQGWKFRGHSSGRVKIEASKEAVSGAQSERNVHFLLLLGLAPVGVPVQALPLWEDCEWTMNANMLIPARLRVGATTRTKVPAKAKFFGTRWTQFCSASRANRRLKCDSSVEVLRTQILHIWAPGKLLAQFSGTIILVKGKNSPSLKMGAFHRKEFHIPQILLSLTGTWRKQRF